MKVAIIGAGIVGSTAAYYLSKEAQVDVTVYDHGVGQATKAAAGIISPWFSKRRNKAWYRLARLGADFYQELVEDLAKDGIKTDFYQQTGVYLLKKNEEKLGWNIYIPKFEYTTDNAAMIAMVAQLKYERGEFAELSISATARYELD